MKESEIKILILIPILVESAYSRIIRTLAVQANVDSDG
jgi:hypothetical protein